MDDNKVLYIGLVDQISLSFKKYCLDFHKIFYSNWSTFGQDNPEDSKPSSETNDQKNKINDEYYDEWNFLKENFEKLEKEKERKARESASNNID